MHNEMIKKVAGLMEEQASAYTRLESATTQLAVALVQGEPELIESLSRAGQTELLKMRSRLLDITATLTGFAERRAQETEKSPLDADIREQFDAMAKQLLDSARSFQKVAQRASSLAVGGSSFSSACIQMCGIPPTTYSAPYLKYAEGAQAR
jgi:hypothetical protein